MPNFLTPFLKCFNIWQREAPETRTSARHGVNIDSKQNTIINIKEETSDDSDSKESPTPPSDPIAIAGPGHFRHRKEIELMVNAARHRYFDDGTEIEVERNRSGELMPVVPKIIQPLPSTMRDKTIPLEAQRWNAVTACWIDIDHDSSRGTWGRFKDNRRLQKLDGWSVAYQFECQGLFRLEQPSNSNANAELKECREAETPHSVAPLVKQPENPNSKKRRAIPSSSELEQLRRLAAENEDTFESY